MTEHDLLDRFRQPEYTGENRCVPCTVLNVAVAAGLSIAVAVGIRYGVGETVSVTAGTATFLLSAVAIYLRGYLVPGTPRLTETYLPERIRRRFHDRPPGVDDDANVELAMKGIGAQSIEDDRSIDGQDGEDGEDGE